MRTKGIGPQGLGIEGNNGYHIGSPAKQTARSERLYARSEKNAAKGRKAVDEGRDRRADRLLKRAAKQEDKAIRLEEKAKKRKKCPSDEAVFCHLPHLLMLVKW